MSAKVGDKALSGEWEEIKTALKFDITESMIMEFEGASCNIADGEGKLVENLDTTHGLATREVLSGYKCYVVKARVKFEKKSS
ncbi:hypothetical protein ACJ73_05342 [Blastomyces percursus]|uniref:Uncharacterized protein n=1 Tax=Blastomyces percursus TaxID=1658174 RepID=A0A1J9Q5C7_9EURO|nr:hypothetical protein ACJ73_05342 [Blastomyces percursus]